MPYGIGATHNCGIETVFQSVMPDAICGSGRFTIILWDDTDYAVKYNYIADNPRRWAEDEYYSNR